MSSGIDTVLKRTIIERGIREKGFMDADNAGSDKTQVLRTMLTQREDEKREMQELNDKFASYLNRVRFLETQNKKLESDLEELRSKWGFESSKVRDQFDSELSNLRRQIDDATREKALMELRLKRALYDTDLLKRQMEFNVDTVNIDKNKLASLIQLRDTLTTEMEMLENKYRDTMDDITRYRNELDKLLEQMEGIKNELDNESLARVQLQNDLQTLEDQLAFMKAVHEDELNELRALATPSIDTSQFYRTELAKAISDIRRDFEQLNRAQQNELEEYYRVKTEEIKEQAAAEERKQNEIRLLHDSRMENSDTNTLRKNLSKAREDLSNLQRERVQLEAKLRDLEDIWERLRAAQSRDEIERDIELQRIRSDISEKEQALALAVEGNVSLKFEINTYRRLLESEENRLAHGAIAGPSKADDWASSVKAERISVHKSARGPVSIDEIDPSGSFISIVNSSANRDQEMRGWSIRRKIDQQPEVIYYLPSNVTLRARSVIKIYGRNVNRSLVDRDGIIADLIPNWGLGNSTETKLVGEDGQEKAVYYQRIGS